MYMNVVVLCGQLSAPPEVRDLESGSKLVRSLVIIRSDLPRRRVDVVPVVLWDPPPGHDLLEARAGDQVWVAGTVQRRFWSTPEGRRSQLEVVATHVEMAPLAPDGKRSGERDGARVD